MTYDPAEVSAALGERFEIVSVLAPGGQGVTYKGMRVFTQSGKPTLDPVALKLCLPQTESGRIRREIEAAEGLRHSAFASLLEHGKLRISGDDLRYLAWEFIEGDPLNEIIAGGPLDPKTVAIVGRDISEAISHVWSRRIVHRDVKPANIMLRLGRESAVLIDLGVARHLRESDLTAIGMTFGTLGYLSPEQALAERALTCKSDIFSLGVVLVESLLGRHPTGGRQDALLAPSFGAIGTLPTAPASIVLMIDEMISCRAAFRPLPEIVRDRFVEILEALG